MELNSRIDKILSLEEVTLGVQENIFRTKYKG